MDPEQQSGAGTGTGSGAVIRSGSRNRDRIRSGSGNPWPRWVPGPGLAQFSQCPIGFARFRLRPRFRFAGCGSGIGLPIAGSAIDLTSDDKHEELLILQTVDNSVGFYL